MRLPTTLRMDRDGYVSLEGPVERRGDSLVLCVPLSAGGEQLRHVASSTSYEEDGNLVVVLPNWLAERIKLDEGASVHVDDRWGKLNIARLH